MKNLLASELLAVWERGYGQNALLRSQMLLSAAFPEMSSDALDSISIGQRDNLLMQLRIDLFGPSLSAITSCPQCKERLELSLSLPDSPQRPPDPGQEILISQGGYDLRLRLPNFRDLMNLSQTDHPPYDRRKLLDLCIQDAKHLGVKCNSEQLPKELIDAVSETMSEADSTSSDQLSLSCPSCHFSWQETLDTASFLWAEIDAWALRTLREVHAISSRYGWSESEILELSPLRRRIYLEMVSE